MEHERIETVEPEGCDARHCPAPAAVYWTAGPSELAFCRHHSDEKEIELLVKGWRKG